MRTYNETLKVAQMQLQSQIDTYNHRLRVASSLIHLVDSHARFNSLHARMYAEDGWEQEPVCDSEFLAQLRDAAQLMERIEVQWPYDLTIAFPRWEQWFDVWRDP